MYSDGVNMVYVDELDYSYIYPKGKGYRIQKDNVHFGFYERLCDALFDRDRFVQVNWDWDLFLELPDIPNHYAHMNLSFKNNRKHKYYTTLKNGGYVVQKWMNGSPKRFGTYDNVEDAENRVKELILNDWKG